MAQKRTPKKDKPLRVQINCVSDLLISLFSISLDATAWGLGGLLIQGQKIPEQ